MAQALFPSMLCTSFVEVIRLLDDHAVSLDGTAVYEVAYQIIWSCLVEDSNLFLKYFMEQLTREKAVETFQIIRKLIRFIPELPQQAAFSLYNYIISYLSVSRNRVEWSYHSRKRKIPNGTCVLRSRNIATTSTTS